MVQEHDVIARRGGDVDCARTLATGSLQGRAASGPAAAPAFPAGDLDQPAVFSVASIPAFETQVVRSLSGMRLQAASLAR